MLPSSSARWPLSPLRPPLSYSPIFSKFFNTLVFLSSKRRRFETSTTHDIIVSVIVVVKLVIINGRNDRVFLFPVLCGSPLASAYSELDVVGIGLGENINRVWVWIRVRVDGGPISASLATQPRHRRDYFRP